MIILVLLSPLVIIILIEVVSVLLSAGADTELYTATGCCGTALHLATAMADLRLVQALLTRGADVNSVNVNNITPLHTASLNGRTEVCDLLLGHGSQIECRDKIGFTPLLVASQGGHLDTARLLVTRGARTDAAQRRGAMPIHKAAQNNRHEVVEFLVREAGVSVNVVSSVFINYKILNLIYKSKFIIIVKQ